MFIIVEFDYFTTQKGNNADILNIRQRNSVRSSADFLDSNIVEKVPKKLH